MKGERKRKGWRRLLIYLGGGLILILIGFFVTLHMLIPKKLQQHLLSLPPVFKVQYSSIQISLFASKITLNDLDIVFTPDSSGKKSSHHVHFTKARLHKINFFKFAFSKYLSANSVELAKADISLDSLLLEKQDSSTFQPRMKLPFEKLFVGNIQIPEAKIYLRSNRSSKLIATGDLAIIGLHHSKARGIKFEDFYCKLSNINYKLPRQQQFVQVQSLLIKSKKLEMEDLKIQDHSGQTALVVEMIKLNDFDVQDLLHKKLIADELIIQHAKAGSKSLLNSMRQIPLYVDIKRIKAGSMAISYKNKNDEWKCKADVTIEDLRIENSDSSFTPGSFEFGNIHCDLSDILFSIPGKMHNVQIKRMVMDSRRKTVEIESLKTIPQYDKYEFGRKRGKQGNWIKATVSQVKAINADIHALFHQSLKADEIVVGRSDVYVFRDRRLPRKVRNQLLPVAYMKQVPIDIMVGKLTVDPSLVVYEELPMDWRKTGTLKLVGMQLTLTPLINRRRDGKPDYMDLHAKASLMGSGTAEAYFKLPLDDAELYYVKGRFEELSLPSLNSTAENLGDFSIKSGLLDFLNFEFTMSAQRAKGKIVGEYHNLVIDKIKIDSRDSTRKEKAGFSSFMLHRVIIPRNKDKSMPEKKRTGKVDYRRDPTRFVTYYFIKSLLDGIRSSFTFGFVLPK